jgi:NADPH2:quinone reductase
MKAVVITEPGDTSVLEIKEVPVPEPGSSEIRVKVKAFGVNRADILQRKGFYPAPPGAPEDIPGLEYSGEIDSVGPDVENVAIGDKIMGLVDGGSYAEYVISAAGHVLPIPGETSFETAAAIPEIFITAFDALERLQVIADEWVLVQAVGSGVGTAALQLINARNAKCVGTSRNPEKLERAKQLGMIAGFDSSDEDYVSKIKKVTGKGANAAIDLLGGGVFPSTLAALAPLGRVIVVGLTAGRKAHVDLGLVLGKRLKIEGTVLRSRSREEKTELVRKFKEKILPLFSSGTLKPVEDKVFAIEEIRECHNYVESNANFGKVVVKFK